jgi:hypothetical protein
MAGIERNHNLAIGSGGGKALEEELAWKHRDQGAFEFEDYQGRQGRPNGRYLAWHLPTSHGRKHSRTSKGRQKKINRELKDLVTKQERGNGGERVDRLFHPNGAVAGKSYNRRPAVDAYWPGHITGGQFYFWRVFTRL